MLEHAAKLYFTDDEKPHQQLQELCHRYRIECELVSDIPESAVLRFSNKRVRYQKADSPAVSFELEKSYLKFMNQRRKGVSTGPFGKAMGKTSKSVVDATCGSGVDSMFMLAMGMEVWAYERNPLVAFLMEEALLFYRNQNNDFSQALKSFHFQVGDVTSYLSDIENKDALYYDPMFPEKKKTSALARKEMELFKDIVGKDEDERLILGQLLNMKGVRIIVKRPLKQEPLVSGPVASFSGKTTRYDLYKS